MSEYFHVYTKQEAQLPLRNRASAMYFFVAKLLSIAVMTYSCVYIITSEASGLPWVWRFPWEFPWIWAWDGYWDCDESPWVCGNSVGIFEWM